MARAHDNLARLPDDAETDNAARCIDVHLAKKKRARAVTIERAPRGPSAEAEPPVRETAMEQLERTRAAAETAWQLMGDQRDGHAGLACASEAPSGWNEDLASVPPTPRRAETLSEQIRDAASDNRQLVVEARHGQSWSVHLCTDLENADEAVARVHALRDAGEADEVCMTLETVRDGGRTTRLEMLRLAGGSAGAAITTQSPQASVPTPNPRPVQSVPPPPAPVHRDAARTERPARTATTNDDDADAILSSWLDRVDGRKRPSVLDDEDDDPDPRDVVSSFNAGLARQALKQVAFVGVAAAIILGGLLVVLNGAWAPDGLSASVYPQSSVLSPN